MSNGLDPQIESLAREEIDAWREYRAQRDKDPLRWRAAIRALETAGEDALTYWRGMVADGN